MGSSRTAIPHAQRVALRHYYQNTNPKPSHYDLKIWFKSHFGHDISQSIVSRSLSDSFAYLDVSIPYQVVPKFRMRSCQWPWLDLMLSDWLHVVESQSAKVSNDVIKRKARQIWNDSDESQGLAMPKFSSGWVAKFRKRNEMRNHASETQAHITSSPSPSGSIQARIITSTHSKRNFPTNRTSSESEFSTSTTTLTLSSDHLMRLIQLNVFRGLISNKSLLRTAAIFIKAPLDATLIDQSSARLCGGPSVLRPLSDHNMPSSLYPTLLQMNCVHTSWIDMFPFPKFRDNLIKKGANFASDDMRQDLFGDIFPEFGTQSPRDIESALLSTLSSTSSISVASNNGEFGNLDDYTAGRTGLITWGDPWKTESWEVTPSFVKKWGWVLEGCDDLIQASNRWRASRNEKLMIWQ